MAELYLARATGIEGFEKIVALKRILPQNAEHDDFVSMFLDEARLSATIQHANVAQVYDIGRCDDGLFFTMEYVHGEDVRSIMQALIKRGVIRSASSTATCRRRTCSCRTTAASS
jgi:serine/threonine protein kinase